MLIGTPNMTMCNVYELPQNLLLLVIVPELVMAGLLLFCPNWNSGSFYGRMMVPISLDFQNAFKPMGPTNLSKSPQAINAFTKANKWVPPHVCIIPFYNAKVNAFSPCLAIVSEVVRLSSPNFLEFGVSW